MSEQDPQMAEVEAMAQAAAARISAAQPDFMGAVIADRYRIEKRIGEGGMGQVFIARHLTLPREVAIKVLHPSLTADPDSVARFHREAANSARVNSPHVATVYDFGSLPGGQLYLAMELVKGEGLSDLIEREGALDPTRVAKLISHVAEGLDAAHRLGIVHRDLKPDNILIGTDANGREIAKVVDFGISTAFQGESQKVTKTGLVAGTLEYMSPEQVSAVKVDQRSDVYSLALVAYVMLTGKNPFPGETAMMSMLRRLSDPPKRLRDLKPDVEWPERLQEVFEKGLAREVEDRFQTAGAFAGGLTGAISQWTHATGAEPELFAGKTTLIDVKAPPKPMPPSAPAAPPAAGATAAPEAKKPPMALIAGGVAAAAVVGVLLVMKGGNGGNVPPGGTPSPPATPAAATPTGSAPAGASPAPGAAAAPAPVNPAATTAAASPAITRAPAPPRQASTSSTPAAPGNSAPAPGGEDLKARGLRAQLDELDQEVSSPSATAAVGREVIARVGPILAALPSADDSAYAYYILGAARVQMEENSRACTEFGRAAALAREEKLRQRVALLRQEVCK